ncbi:GGDEF domain-containing protein [Butyrivibrio sp. WCD3002]|uniref:GGDEF domain-containing protein n=1 Tax=Butyrivibrio sp. WCD3002 TaxID=1280676 RepID=UPI000412867D|nr:diguanylate cyclase [Butyrivibrio sp. WCD3002]
MPYKRSLLKKIRIAKIVMMAILIILSISYLLILILNSEFRASILGDAVFLITFIITWLCLLTGFLAILMDFILMKKNIDVAKDLSDLSFLDKLTSLPNRFSIDRISSKYDTQDKLMHLGCVLMELDNLKELNDKNGRSGGDEAISSFCTILESVGMQYGLIGRNSGNEFIVVIENCSQPDIDSFLEVLGKRIKNHNTLNSEIPIRLRYSHILGNEVSPEHFYVLIAAVYRKYESDSKVLN